MTPLPKKKSTRSRTNARKINQRVATGSLVKCASCGKLRKPHRACPSCGFYR